MGFIENRRLRKVTCCKRKKGLIKKAMEFSMLCGNDVLLIIRDRTMDQVVMYNSCFEENKDLFNEIYVNGNYSYACSNLDVRPYLIIVYKSI